MRVVLDWDFFGPGADWLRKEVPGAEIVVLQEGAELAPALADADAFAGPRLTAADTRDARRLRLIQMFAAGRNSVPDDAIPKGCALCNVFEHEQAIAEWALMNMLALSRDLVIHNRDLRRGYWHTPWPRSGLEGQSPLHRELRGRTVGAIGFGHIGTRLAELATALGMRAVAVTRTPTAERGIQTGLDRLGGLDELPRLLQESDFAVVCVPLTPDTEGLIGARELELLGAEGYLLNVARGPVVQEEALYNALRDGVIAGAAIDVWYKYRSRVDEQILPATFPFWELDNIIMTPHVAGQSESMVHGRWAFLASQLQRLVEGRPLENIVAVGT